MMNGNTPITNAYANRVTSRQAFEMSRKEMEMRRQGKSEAEIENKLSDMVVWFLSKNQK